ncbi:hypothetical protein CALCODRAFT_371391 [Calocera cornea HHB12733]|uniref:Uncharacterized protein n=1 Tax=Calocera cornea HHB12733 TaxID=1353952 RepID=A0A165EHA4_9BASI|nr:hypothetical protein CALCODRAFT_371391 [Calocera cornea HHB12733]
MFISLSHHSLSQHAHLLNRLVQLKHISLIFYYDSNPNQVMDPLQFGTPLISLPSLISSRLCYRHHWRACKVLLAAFNRQSLTLLHVDISRAPSDFTDDYFPALAPDLETLVLRHSRTFSDLALWSSSPRDHFHLISPLTSLRRLLIAGPADSWILRTMPSTVEQLEVPLFQQPHARSYLPPPPIRDS